MLFADYPEISSADYKIPNGIEPEYMIQLANGDMFDRRVHDYLILVGSRKFTTRQINRILYLSKYSAWRIRERIKKDIQSKGCENTSEKITALQ